MSKLYNPESTESFSDAKIIGGSPNGIINFNETPHKWASTIYRMMEQYTWFPEECNLAANDKVPYKNLTDAQRYAYDMSLSQLITNDSVQAKQLIESISEYVTSPVVNACLARQAYEETNHSRSYSVTADEVCEDSDRIYNLYKTEPALARKNQAVADMYSKVNSADSDPTPQELLLAFTANQILEELVFPGGFVTIWSIGLVGTNKMISFIERDESGTHVPLFKNIFREAVKLNGLDDETETKALNLIAHMTNEEKIWTKHISKGLLGFSEQAVDLFIESKANSVCENLKLPLLYDKTNGGPLASIASRYSMLSEEKTKSNFFEVTVGDYSIGGLDDDY